MNPKKKRLTEHLNSLTVRDDRKKIITSEKDKLRRENINACKYFIINFT